MSSGSSFIVVRRSLAWLTAVLTWSVLSTSGHAQPRPAPADEAPATETHAPEAAPDASAEPDAPAQTLDAEGDSTADEAEAQPEDAAPTETAQPETTPLAPMAPTADEEAPKTRREPIEVVARGNAKTAQLRESARAVQVLDLEKDRGRSADLGEVLARSSGLSVRRSGGLGSETHLMLNGLSGDQIRIFMDGVPLHLTGYPFGLGNVPTGFIDHIAVYRGVVPTALGADALGGAVDLITQENLRKNATEVSYQTGSFGTHRLAARATGYLPEYKLYGRASAFLDSSANDYLVDVDVANDDGQQSRARVRRSHGAYRALGAHAEVGVLAYPWAQKLRVRTFYTENDSQLQHSPNMQVPYGDATFAKRSYGALVQYNQKFFKHSRLDVTVGYTHLQTQFQDLSHCVYDWYGRCFMEVPTPGEVSRSNALDQSLSQHNLYARASWLWNLADDHKLRFSLAPTYTHQEGKNAYVRAEIDPMRAERPLLSGVAGAEYESSWFDGRLENIAFGKAYLLQLATKELLPNLATRDIDRTTRRLGAGDSLRLRIADSIFAKASYEYATRLPNPEEMFGDGILTIATLDLKPEKSHNLNLGISVENLRTEFGQLRFGLHGFGRVVDDLILKIGAIYYEYKNVMSARVLGLESNAGWTSPGEYVSIDGNMTLQDLRNTASGGTYGAYKGDRLPSRPYAMANGSIRLKAKNVSAKNDSLELIWDTRYVHSFYRDWDSLKAGNEIPDQLTHAIALMHTLRGDPLAATFTVEVLNLTDESVFDFFGAQRPGRSVFFKMTLAL